MNKLWIAGSALQQLEALGRGAFPLETGGILTGYVADTGELVVQELIGPGPQATHGRFSFAPDHAWQSQRLDELYQASAGITVYLGDWHTHPRGAPKMSWADRRTLQRIARFTPARCPNPIMMIGGGGPSEWHWNCFQYSGSSLLGITAEVQECDLIPY